MARSARWINALLAAALMTVGATYAFANGQQDAGTTSASAPMQISWMGQNPRGYTIPQDNLVVEKLDKMFNVDIKSVQVDMYDAQQVNLIFASGDIPDFIHYSSDVSTLYKLGVVRSIPRDMLDKNYPNLVQQVQKLSPEGTAWNDVMIDGKIMGLPTVNITVQAREMMATRKDWMDAVGFKTDLQKYDYAYYSDGGLTIDQVGDLLKRYRYDDPNGDGKQDTYGIGVHSNSSSLESQDKFPTIFGAYNVRLASWQVENGKIVWSLISERYRQALTTLARWYKEGIVDPEFVTDKRGDLVKKFSNGLVGAYGENNRWVETALDTAMGKLLLQHPDVSPVYILNIKGPDGGGASPARSRASFGTHPQFGVGTSDAKVAKILQMLNVIQFDKNLYPFVRYGEEGVNWNYDDKGFVNPVAKFTSGEQIAKLGLETYSQNNEIDAFGVKYRLDARRYVPWYIGSLKDGLQDQLTKPLSGDVRQQYDQIRTDIAPLEQEFFYKAITGDFNLTSDWDSYLKKWKQQGGDKLTAWANQAQYGS